MLIGLILAFGLYLAVTKRASHFPPYSFHFCIIHFPKFTFHSRVKWVQPQLVLYPCIKLVPRFQSTFSYSYTKFPHFFCLSAGAARRVTHLAVVELPFNRAQPNTHPHTKRHTHDAPSATQRVFNTQQRIYARTQFLLFKE